MVARRGGILPTFQKALHVVRQEGMSGLRHRYRALTERPPRYTSVRPALTVKPLVTVIVPNYNHAAYLEQRLETIFAQSYDNIEVILLDDHSTDRSVEILEEFAARYPDKTRVIVNEENSGSGYRQWAKGLAEARGELVWIAESDDWSDPLFLETLIPAFDDESVMLAYTNSAFMDADGNDVVWSTPEYLNDVDRRLWTKPFTRTAHELMCLGWATKNLVPNVSSAVFRNPGQGSDLLAGAWTQTKICGDWLFYLALIRGGSVAYNPGMLNYYRVHQGSTAQSTYKRDVYYREHELVARYALEHYAVPDDFVRKQEANLRKHWKRFRDDFSEDAFKACYDPVRLEAANTRRKPNILLATYAFVAGGGETFPIFLANLFKAHGYTVTLLSCDREPREEGVRDLLRPDIPVVTDIENIARLVERFGIDIVHSHHSWVDSEVLINLPKGSRAQAVISMHGTYELMQPIDQDAVVPRLVQRSGAVVFTSGKNLKPLERLGLADSPKIVGIPNALPAVRLEPVDRRDLDLAPDSFVLCLVSRAIPEKGWEEALEAVARARAMSDADIRLLLIGEGPEYDRLRPTVPEFARFLGFRKNVRDYFATADLGFLPSRFKGESFPLTLIDCLAVGTPFLASDVGEIRHMLDASGRLAGATVSLRDWELPVDEMAEIIARAAGRGADYEGMRESVAEAYKKFDPDVMVERYANVYDAVLRGSEPCQSNVAHPAEARSA